MSRERRRGELVDFLNRLIMLEQESVDVTAQLVREERTEPTRDLLKTILDEDRRAIEVAERAIRDLGGRPSTARKTAGFIAARTKFLIEEIPVRAKEVVRTRDLKAAREGTPFSHLVALVDALNAHQVANAHWALLKTIAEESNERAIVDAVNEVETASSAHVKFFEERAQKAVRERFITSIRT